MKKSVIKLILAVVAIVVLVRLCSQSFGSVITLPGGLGKESSDDSGGWFSPKGHIVIGAYVQLLKISTLAVKAIKKEFILNVGVPISIVLYVATP